MFEANDLLIVKVTQDALYFDAQHALPVKQIALKLAGITEIERFTSMFEWLKLKVRKFESGTLLCEIMDFNPWEKRVFESQDFDLSSVNKLLLFSAETFKILKLAQRKFVRKAPAAVKKPQPVVPPKPKIPQKEKSVERPNVVTRQKPSQPPKPVIIQKTIYFKTPFSNVTFDNGFAEVIGYVFDKQLPHRLIVHVQIPNAFIRKEFEYIKEYFVKLLKAKEISTKAEVKIINGQATVLKASSPQIARIGPDLIGEIKVNLIKKKLRQKSHGNSILTLNQWFASGEKHEKAAFDLDDMEFIDKFIRIKKPKHGEHIRYLIERHNPAILRLRIITNPISFVFFLEGKQRCFLAWETLFGTDGTYLWALPQNLQELLQNKKAFKQSIMKIENDIKRIKAEGRLPYLKNKPDNFIRIFHNYRDVRGFETWKKELDALLDAER